MWLWLWACGGGSGSTEPKKIVVYSGRSESLVAPVFAALEKELGIEIEVQYGKTPEIVTRLLTEGAETPADVVLAQDSGHLGALAERGMLTVLSDRMLSGVEERFRDPAGHWIGTSGRLRTLVVDSQASEVPETLEDLADPRFAGKIGWAPGNGSFQAHVSVLRHHWGEKKTQDWLVAVKANGARSYPKNSPQVAAANTGEIVAGFVNHYYLHRLEKEGRRAQNRPFADPIGNVMMVAGAGVVKHTDQEMLARRVVTGLTDEKRQTYFTTEVFEYPTRAGMSAHPDVAPLSGLTLGEVKQAHLADLAPTLKMLQEVGLQ